MPILGANGQPITSDEEQAAKLEAMKEWVAKIHTLFAEGKVPHDEAGMIIINLAINWIFMPKPSPEGAFQLGANFIQMLTQLATQALEGYKQNWSLEKKVLADSVGKTLQ
jgi:hypothetical protein